MLHVRIDERIKAQAADALEAMGLTVSEAVRVFLHRVAVEQALPFEMKVPNAVTQAAMAEARRIDQARHAGAQALFDGLSAEGHRKTAGEHAKVV